MNRIRTKRQVDNDGIMPNGKYGFGVTDKYILCRIEKRHRAAEELLCSLPQSEYEAFLSKRPAWIVPALEIYGTCKQTPVSDHIIYLSPRLEEMREEEVTSIVAHEIAHLVLNHKLADCTPEEDEMQENEAWAKAGEWGYEKVELPEGAS